MKTHECQQCGSDRIMQASAHGRDCCYVSIGDWESQGYMVGGLNVGGGDDMEIEVCLDCGTMQGEWPLSAERVAEITAEIDAEEAERQARVRQQYGRRY